MTLFTISAARSCPGDRLRSYTVAPVLETVAIGDPGLDDMLTGGLINRHTRVGYLHLSLTFSDIQPHPSDLSN